MSLAPQLRPTDFQKLETLTDREDRERAFADSAIYRHEEPQGIRYTKGTSVMVTKRSWQSLDAILRSDASSSAALPKRDMRISRVFSALTVVAGILTVAGTAASAREGLDLQQLNGTGAVLLAGGLASVGFGITSGIFYGKTKRGYEEAIEVYNDSLSVRLGLNTAAGDYIPAQGVLVDEDGYIMLDERERPVGPSEAEPEETEELVAEEPVDEVPVEDATPEVATPPTEAVTPTDIPEPEVQTPSSPVVPAPGGSAAAPDSEPRALELRPR